MPRPRLPIGAHGTIKIDQIAPGKWRARTLYRFEDGQRRQVERFGPTKAKSLNALQVALTTAKAPERHSTGFRRGMTVRALGEAFLAAKFSEVLSPNTMESYEGAVRGIISPSLGSMTVDEVRPLRIQEFLDEVKAANGSGQAYNCRKVLKGMFDLARLHSLVPMNPAEGVKVKSADAGKRAAKALAAEETEKLLAACRANPSLVKADIPDIWEFMSMVGSRLAETLALTWECVDFKKGTVSLGPSVMVEKGKPPYIWGKGKSEASNRTIVVPKRVMELLERRRASVPETPEGLVFPSPLGKLYVPTYVSQVWKRHRASIGYPNFTSHAFRKTVATMLDKQPGVTTRDIADYLGHSRVSMTQDRYMARGLQSPAIAQTMDSMFGESSGSEGEDGASAA